MGNSRTGDIGGAGATNDCIAVKERTILLKNYGKADLSNEFSIQDRSKQYSPNFLPWQRVGFVTLYKLDHIIYSFTTIFRRECFLFDWLD